ncbi:MAG: hypothetical protein R3C56_20810 [Pirellulaceae bacterium]
MPPDAKLAVGTVAVVQVAEEQVTAEPSTTQMEFPTPWCLPSILALFIGPTVGSPSFWNDSEITG